MLIKKETPVWIILLHFLKAASAQVVNIYSRKHLTPLYTGIYNQDIGCFVRGACTGGTLESEVPMGSATECSDLCREDSTCSHFTFAPSAESCKMVIRVYMRSIVYFMTSLSALQLPLGVPDRLP